MGLADLTKSAVDAALAEYDRIGKDAFLSTYGFGDAKRYWLEHNGNLYPSKAIAGAAHRYLAPNSPALKPVDFVGGQATVVRKLRLLGFEFRSPGRNPTWSRDELILALDLYFTNPSNPPGKGSAEVAELSELLNKLHRLEGDIESDTLRNPNGIYLKMMNLRALDPAFIAQGKVGMKAGGALEKVIWSEYADRRAELATEAALIKEAIATTDEGEPHASNDRDAYEGKEGGVIVRLHRRYERDSKLISEKKRVSRLDGVLSCEVCGFDFAKRYGELGTDFIEVHHINPIHLMKAGEKTKLSDLALLCSNCHRMAHRKRLPLTLDELRSFLRD